MTEIDGFKQVDCQSVGTGKEEEVVFSRELHIQRGERWFSVSVATPGYVGYIQNLNASLPKDSRRFDNYLPIEDLTILDDVCRQISALPKELLLPYLSEVVLPSESTESTEI